MESNMQLRLVISCVVAALFSTTACAGDAVRAIDSLIGIVGGVAAAAAKQQKETAAQEQQQQNDPAPINQDELLEGLQGGKAPESKPIVASKAACQMSDYLDYGFMKNWSERLSSYPPKNPANSQNPDPYNLIGFEQLVHKAAEKCGQELVKEKSNREAIKALGPRPPQLTQGGYDNHNARLWDANVKRLQYDSAYTGIGLGCFRAENERSPNFPISEDVLYQRCLATFKDGTTAVSVWAPEVQANYGKAVKDFLGLMKQRETAQSEETANLKSARNRDLKFAFKSIAMRQQSGVIEKSGKYDCKELSSREVECVPKSKIYEECTSNIVAANGRNFPVCNTMQRNEAGEEWNSAAGHAINLKKSRVVSFDGRVAIISVNFMNPLNKREIDSLVAVMRERYGPETLTEKAPWSVQWHDKHGELVVRNTHFSIVPTDALYAEMKQERERMAQGKKAEAEAAQAARLKERQKQQARDL
jgi:hypothetical protein